MKSSAYGLAVLAVSCLREAIAHAQTAAGGAWQAQRDAVDHFHEAHRGEAELSAEVVCRATAGSVVPAVVTAMLAHTRHWREGGQAPAIRLVRSEPPTAADSLWRLVDGAVRHVPIELPAMVVGPARALLLEPARLAAEQPAGVLVIQDESAVNLLTACHDILWWATCESDAAQAMPQHLEEVVAELSTGVTDAAAGRALHVSERTVSRRMSEVLEYLGATSRFQAGIIAGREGMV